MNKLLLCLIALCVLFSGQALAGTSGQIGKKGKIKYRWNQIIPNDTGQEVNDLHISLKQEETDVHFTGIWAKCDQFTTLKGKLVGDHNAEMNLSGGTLAPRNTAIVGFIVDMNKKNNIWVSWDWTRDTVPIPMAKKKVGAVVRDPVKIPKSSGEIRTLADGQGDDGDVDDFIHKIIIYNDFEATDIWLEHFNLLASMTYYDELSAIDFSVATNAVDSPVVIPIGGSWTYDFETIGPYWGGHIYFDFTIAYLADPFAADPEIYRTQIVGDHPVPTPEPATALLLGAGLVGLLRLNRRRRHQGDS